MESNILVCKGQGIDKYKVKEPKKSTFKAINIHKKLC
jgi:hypothetical protein